MPLLLLPLPAFLNQYQQYVVNMMLMYVPVGVGFNLVVGNLGLLAFSNVAFLGIGAYASGVLMTQAGPALVADDRAGRSDGRHSPARLRASPPCAACAASTWRS